MTNGLVSAIPVSRGRDRMQQNLEGADRSELQDALKELKATQGRLLQAQKLEAIGQLAAGIAHEINTPIQYVTDNVEFLSRAFTRIGALLTACRPLLEEV